MKFAMTLIAAAFVASPAVAALDGGASGRTRPATFATGPGADKPLMPNYPKLAGQNAYAGAADEGHQRAAPATTGRNRRDEGHAPGQ